MASEQNRRILLIVATAQSVICVVRRALIVDSSSGVVDIVLKVAPVFMLAAVALLRGETNAWEKTYSDRIGIGLLICAIGDAVLEIKGMFVPGLLLFLVAHLFYISALLNGNSGGKWVWLNRIVGLLWGAIVISIYTFLAPHAGEKLQVPLMFYVSIIGLMVYRAFTRSDPVYGNAGYYYTLVGAIAFGISDFLLAYNKFVSSFEQARYVVIFFYYIAQIAISTSTILPLDRQHLQLRPSQATRPKPVEPKENKGKNNKTNKRTNKKKR